GAGLGCAFSSIVPAIGWAGRVALADPGRLILNRLGLVVRVVVSLAFIIVFVFISVVPRETLSRARRAINGGWVTIQLRSKDAEGAYLPTVPCPFASNLDANTASRPNSAAKPSRTGHSSVSTS